MPRKITTALLVISLGLSGCDYLSDLILGKSILPEEIPGIYKVDRGYAQEKLVLSQDETFHQEITVNDKKVVSDGHWKFSEGMQEITLDEHHILVYDERGNFNPNFETSKTSAGTYMVHRSRKGLKFGGIEGSFPYRKVIPVD